MNFVDFFARATESRSPYPYQQRLAEGVWPETLLVPTGFGKTAAVLAAWLWKVSEKNVPTPRRLVYCLPMRTLVEQTEAAARLWIKAARRELGIEVHLDVLMGGRTPERSGIPDWITHPERPTILVGTQDLLVSAALMRGYGVTRYRWPVDFALLHNDALWVLDEVQLTGATLTTSAQLEAFRRRFETAKRSQTLWMSATLDPAWLRTVDFDPVDRYRSNDLSKEDLSRVDHLWSARKSLAQIDVGEHDLGKKGLKFYAAALAKKAGERMRPRTNTILFLNTVGRAQAVFKALGEQLSGPELLLVHSRFRAADRQVLTERLGKTAPAAGRIVVATQALEAGVDVTSAVMITEIAPWSSLVQRIGRCNRYGECGETSAEVFWIDLPNAAGAAPYEPSELVEAREKLAGLTACGPSDLAGVPPSAPPRGQVIRGRDLTDLFDTDPDLSGFDVDVAIYVRDAKDTDVRVFWRPVEGSEPADDAPSPQRDELCPAPIGGAKELVKRANGRAWRWNTLTREWTSVWQNDLFPGLLLWIDVAVGGYDSQKGFDPSSKVKVESLEVPGDALDGIGDDRDSGTKQALVSLAKHTDHVRAQAQALVDALGASEDDRALLLEAALWHDWGKAHDSFVAKTPLDASDSPFLAKWPRSYKPTKEQAQRARRYFRHELASALGYLARHAWKDNASLPAYLIAAHHGKVRMRLRALPKENPAPDNRLFARGVHDGDLLPATRLGELDLPGVTLDLDIMQLGDSDRCGASWSTRSQRLLKEHGPFRLAWLEALLRIADWRASAEEGKLDHDDL